MQVMWKFHEMAKRESEQLETQYECQLKPTKQFIYIFFFPLRPGRDASRTALFRGGGIV